MFRGRRYYRPLCVVLLASTLLGSTSGCHMIFPDVCHQPMVHNPFPQLSRVAIAPFFNQSDEPTVDGRKFALAYFAELQGTPGFEVVPLGVVEEAILAHQIDLSHAGEARRLATVLGVDVVVIGSVTDYTPYYPPRCGLRVEWYAANPGFHEIPPGYGLPWGTPEEEFIPQPLVFEAEMALAKAEMAGQTPDCPAAPIESPRGDSSDAPKLFSPVPSANPPAENPSSDTEKKEESGQENGTDAATDSAGDSEISDIILTAYADQVSEEELPPASSGGASLRVLPPQPAEGADTTVATGAHGALPADWPSDGEHASSPAFAVRPPCIPNNGPVMTHTRIYHGNDADFTKALEGYYHFRNDARFGGWQNYLQRSDDFIRFCCHVHIAEMLSARGGADQTRVVWRWPNDR
jgi:hypothetical protein